MDQLQLHTAESFTSILDSLSDSYFEADPTGIITFANWSYVKNLGYETKEEVIGKHFRRFTEPSFIRAVFGKFFLMYQNGQDIEPFDYRCKCKDGTILHGEISISPIYQGNEIKGTRGIIRDISLRVAETLSLHQAKDLAESRAKELALVNRIAQAVSNSLNLQDILQTVCGELTNIFPVRNAGVALLEPNRRFLEVVAFHSSDPEEPTALGIKIPFQGNTSSEMVMESKQTLVIQNAQQDPRTSSLADLSRKRGTQSLMIVPIISRSEAIGTLGMPAKNPTYVFTDHDIELAQTIASQIATAIDNARLYKKTEQALDAAERDLEIGREIQKGFFPATLVEPVGWEVSALFYPARQVAGDFYDVFPLGNTDYLVFAIADVCDKGVGAALFMVLFRSLLRAYSEQNRKRTSATGLLHTIVTSTNTYIARYHGRANMFATMVMGILNPHTGVIQYINAGHEPPVILNSEGTIRKRLMPTGPAVGMFEQLEFKVGRITLKPGDSFVSFTDGATDAQNSEGKAFSEDTLVKTIACPWTSVFSMLYELKTELFRHTGNWHQFDDITLIALRRKITKDTSSHGICRRAQMDQLEQLRDFAEAAAAKSGLRGEHVFVFKLATEELCTNSIQYAYTNREPGYLSVLFLDDGDLVKLTITDDGNPFNSEHIAGPDVNQKLENRDPGGLGIHFIKELMDFVEFQTIPGGNRVTMGINRRNHGYSK